MVRSEPQASVSNHARPWSFPMRRGPSWFNLTSITLGFAFLYLPIVLLVAWSFNASKLVTVWGGFSTKWYAALLQDDQLVAIALVRGGRFRGRTAFSGMVYAPLVMPEVIMGLSLLLLFVALGFGRGFWTVVLAHTTFTLSYVAVVVHSRLVTFDRSLEEAAQDLGCTPSQSFLKVTLPNIFPAVLAGWMLAFTLSLDDLVIASFTSGPGATTLPMRIYSQVRLGVTPEINAVCTLLIATVATGIIVWSLLNKWRSGAARAAIQR